MTPTSSGRIYLDSNVFIYALEGSEKYRTAIARLFDSTEGNFLAITSELTIGECLIGAGSSELAALYLELLSDEDVVRTVPVTRSIIVSAARFGNERGVKLADAIHVTTALAADCNAFVSNDLRLKLPKPLRKIDLRKLAADPDQ